PPTYPVLHSFPTRRSSDLPIDLIHVGCVRVELRARHEGDKAPVSRDHRRAPPKVRRRAAPDPGGGATYVGHWNVAGAAASSAARSEEHTSELQSRFDLVCR